VPRFLKLRHRNSGNKFKEISSSVSISFDGNVWCIAVAILFGNDLVELQRRGNNLLAIQRVLRWDLHKGLCGILIPSGIFTYRLGNWGAGVWSTVSDCAGKNISTGSMWFQWTGLVS